MTSRELFNGIMKAMDSHGVQLAAVAQQNARLERKIDSLAPHSNLPMIPGPIQGVDYARTCNVAEYVDEKVKAHNSNVPENAPRYLEFAAGRSHDDLNRSALTTIGGIIARKYGDNYGGCKTWEKLHNAMPKACEEIIEEARFGPELHVFNQVDGQWCIRELAKNKIKSLFRASRAQRNVEDGQNIEGQADQDIESQRRQQNHTVSEAQEVAIDPSLATDPISLNQNIPQSHQETAITEREVNISTTEGSVERTETGGGGIPGTEARNLSTIGSSSLDSSGRVQSGVQPSATPVTADQSLIETEVQRTARPRTRPPRSGLASRNVRRRTR